MHFFRKSAKPYVDPLEPIPVGQVLEGNEESDWAEWEASVAFQDSQMPEFQNSCPPPKVRAKKSTDTDSDSIDLFASVTKNSP